MSSDDDWLPDADADYQEEALEEEEDGAEELQNDFFGATLDPFFLLEGMGKDETGDHAILQPYEILAQTARQARAAQRAGPSSDSEKEEANLKQKRQDKGKAVFGATVDDIWDEDLAADMGLGLSAKSRKRNKVRAKRRRKAQAKGKKSKQLPEEVTQKLGQGNLLYASGRYQEAITLLTDVIKLDPNLSDPYLTIARSLEAAGNPRKALDFYMIAAHMIQKDVALWKRLATLSSDMGFTRQAIYCLSKVIPRDKEDMDARWDRAVLFIQLGELKKAVAAFEQIAKHRSGDGEVSLMLARLYHHLAQPAKAIAALETQLREGPLATDSTHINILAELYMEGGEYGKAVDLINRAAAQLCGEMPLPIDLQTKASICQIKLGNLEAAAVGVGILRGEAPERVQDLFLEVADALMQTDHPQEALELYDRVVSVELYNPSLWTKMAECHCKLKDHEAAVGVYTQVLTDGSIPIQWHQEAALALAELHASQGNKQEAHAVLKTVEELGTSGPEMLTRKTKLLLSLGDLNGYLDVMLPIVESTLKQASKKKAKTKRNPLAQAERRLRVIQRTSRSKEEDGVFKGYMTKDRRKPHVKEADERLAERLIAAMDEDGDEEGVEEETEQAAPASLADIGRDSAQFETLVQTAQVLMQAGKPLQASDLISECIAALTKRWTEREKKDTLRLLAAEAAMAGGSPALAMHQLRHVVVNQPHSIAVWNLFSRAANSLGTLRPGQKLIASLRERASDSAPLNMLAGHMYSSQGAHDRALGEYMSVYVAMPNNPLVLLCIAVSHLNQAMSPKVPDRDRALMAAFSFFQNYSSNRENRQEAFYNVGRAVHQVGLLELAVVWYKRALAAQPPEALAFRGDMRMPTIDLRREIAHNMAHIYRSWGANDLAKEVLLEHFTV